MYRLLSSEKLCLRKTKNCRFHASKNSSLDNDSQDYVAPKKQGFKLPPLSLSDDEKMKKLKEMIMAKSRGEDAEVELDLKEMDGISPSTLVMKAIRYLSQNQVDEAISYLNNCIEKYPGAPIAHTTLGHAYRTKGELSKSKYNFKKSISIDPNCVDAIIGLANVAIIEKEYEDAMRLLKQALALDEDYATTHSTLGILYDKMDNPKEAIKHHKRAVNCKDVNDPQAFSILGELLARESQFEESLVYLNKAVKLEPHFGSGYIALAAVNLELKNWRPCEENLSEILKITRSEELLSRQQGHTEFKNKFIGLIQYLAGKAKEAAMRKDWDLAHKLSDLSLILKPREEELLLMNALSLFQLNKLDDAVNKLNTLLSLHPKSYSGLTMMSEVKGKLGETSDALKYLMKAQAADPKKAQVDQSVD